MNEPSTMNSAFISPNSSTPNSFVSMYQDILKAPLLNALLFFTVISIHIGRGGFYFFSLSILLYFAFHLLKFDTDNKKIIKETVLNLKSLLLSFLLILAAMSLSNIANDYSNLDAWLYQLKFIFKIPVFLFILLFFYKKDFFTIKTLYMFIIVGVLIQLLDGGYQAVYGYDFFRGTVGTFCEGLTGTTTNRNIFGFLVGLGFFIFLQLMFNHKYVPNKIFFALCASASFFCILYSLSRGLWIAVFIVLGLLVIYNLWKSNFKRSLLVVTILFILLASILSLDCLAARSSEIINDLVSEVSEVSEASEAKKIILQNSSSLAIESIEARLAILDSIFVMINQKPVLGWGMAKMQKENFANQAHPHSMVLEIILHTGVLGLLAFMCCFYVLVKVMLSTANAFLFSLLFYVLLKCIFDHTIFSGHMISATLVLITFFTYAQKIKRNDLE